MAKAYVRLVFGLVLLVACYGFLLPWMISSTSSTLVWMGILIGAACVPAFYSLLRPVYWKLKSTFVRATMGLVLMATFVGCSKVPAGHVGIKVYLLGTSKGVDQEVLPVGRYYIGINEDLFLFPTFLQQYVWTRDGREQSPDDESITFQTKEGMNVNGDIGIAYRLAEKKIPDIFQKYRRGVDEITDTYLRTVVRDAFNVEASKRMTKDIYGTGKTKFIQDVLELVRKQVEPIGILIEKISIIGSLRLPQQVINALNRKIEATQRAEQRENELREATAQAQKKIAEARGQAESTEIQAKAEALSILVRAKAQAQANRLVSESIKSKELVKYHAVKKWDGKLPQISGGQTIPMIDFKTH